ncbi:MAG TPA: hypothetical protein VKC56_13715 [Gallionellaceae bacterium]|nr:hypothetical protein [Gallionellaceae bacterium]
MEASTRNETVTTALIYIRYLRGTTGSTLGSLSFGAQVGVGGGSACGLVQIPVLQKVNSLQLRLRYTIKAGTRKAF